MRIYIMGAVGSGKSTLARCLAKKYDIDYYELDSLVYDDENGHIKRTKEEIELMFNEILNKKSWVIEDIGREHFLKGREECDQIYYIKISKIENFKRVIFRWIKQKLKIENYNYPATVRQLWELVNSTFSYFKNETMKIDSLSLYKDKVVFLNKKDVNRLLND